MGELTSFIFHKFSCSLRKGSMQGFFSRLLESPLLELNFFGKSTTLNVGQQE